MKTKQIYISLHPTNIIIHVKLQHSPSLPDNNKIWSCIEILTLNLWYFLFIPFQACCGHQIVNAFLLKRYFYTPPLPLMEESIPHLTLPQSHSNILVLLQCWLWKLLSHHILLCTTMTWTYDLTHIDMTFWPDDFVTFEAVRKVTYLLAYKAIHFVVVIMSKMYFLCFYINDGVWVYFF